LFKKAKSRKLWVLPESTKMLTCWFCRRPISHIDLSPRDGIERDFWFLALHYVKLEDMTSGIRGVIIDLLAGVF
jgi:hypothetical protein